MPEILVTGADGQLGTELQRVRWPDGWRAVAIDKADLDLADPAAIAARLAERPWAAVINGAAYTVVDKAEDDQVTAWEVNALAPAAFAQACATAVIPLVQVSTDYVFAGDEPGAWEVDDPVAPLGVYGASKLGGELAVRTSGARAAIVRTAWVVSAHGHNFVKTMLRVGADRETLRVVADQHGAPTSAADLAAVLATIAVRLAQDEAAPTGTFHFSAPVRPVGRASRRRSFASRRCAAGRAPRWSRSRPPIIPTPRVAPPTRCCRRRRSPPPTASLPAPGRRRWATSSTS